ncbi:RES family NAD+ phosphorylase [Paenibacillus wynnii]|uniref:RES family NAD+ phosphorylase n=1 Tax=Paenibacillus wynnii TaxID=268407 RepID=UPI00278CA9DD|nr:RES family NAD+ phosphorylase [Paenibacillus wynnii]MDQ0195353.1 RES domain-containing protein [Paenibacillus wynnii]
MNYYVCSHCLKDKFLIKYAEENASSGQQCFICKSTGREVINVENDSFQNLFKAVIRYHYAEYHYNPHFGGYDSVEQIFCDENPILNHRFQNEWDSDELFSVLPNEHNSDPEKGVSIFYGYLDEVRWMFSTNLQDHQSTIINKFEKRMQSENYFLIEKDVLSLLKSNEEFIKRNIIKGTHYYRARIGLDKTYYNKTNFDYSGMQYFYKPFTNEAISAPPPPLSSSGRLNRQGVSYLYLSLDINTAISEVRPHPGHLISVGKFALTRDVIVADLCDIDLRLFCTDDMLEIFVALNDIAKKFAMPIVPEDRNRYQITQLFAEVFRKLKFDGILFKSSVTGSENLVLFDPSLGEYCIEESEVYSCEKVGYDLKTINKGILFKQDDYEEC